MTSLKDATPEQVKTACDRMARETAAKARRPTKRQQAADRQRANAAYGRVAHGVLVPVLSLGAIMDAGLAAIAAGADEPALEAAMRSAVDKVKTA